MITAIQFVVAVENAADEIREYLWGASGENGKCDCVGLIMDALEKCGMKWPGVHGTNWAERHAMKSRGPITGPGELFPGEVLYKYREPGMAKWKLPDDYKNDPDQRDYYHVGVVTSVEPLVITHCTDVPGGIKRNMDLGTWRWGGELKYVEYEEGGRNMEYPYYAEVWAPNEFPVRMRKEPKRDAKIIEEVPQKSIVDVMGEIGTDEDGIWGFIRHGAVTGYMMKKFLRPVQQDAPEEDADLPEVDLMEEAEKALKEAMESMSNALAAVQAAKEAR